MKTQYLVYDRFTNAACGIYDNSNEAIEAAKKVRTYCGLVLPLDAMYWNAEADEAVTLGEIVTAWEYAKRVEDYDGSFSHYLYDDCLGKNGALITWKAHEADLAKSLLDEYAAAVDFGEA